LEKFPFNIIVVVQSTGFNVLKPATKCLGCIRVSQYLKRLQQR